MSVDCTANIMGEDWSSMGGKEGREREGGSKGGREGEGRERGMEEREVCGCKRSQQVEGLRLQQTRQLMMMMVTGEAGSST